VPINATCPSCGAVYPIEHGLTDAAARAALAAALAMPSGIANLVIPYLGLHAPAGRKVQMAKLARVIDELVALINAGEVSRRSESRPAPLPAWSAGLAEVLKMRDAGSLELPLQGHGLLCEIVFRQATKAGAQQAASSRPMHPSHRPAEIPSTPGLPAPEPTQAPPDWASAKRSGAQHVGALLGKLRPREES
jgi:hypothetical protein